MFDRSERDADLDRYVAARKQHEFCVVWKRIAPGLSWMVKAHGVRWFIGIATDVGGEVWWLPRVQTTFCKAHSTVRIGWLWAAVSFHAGNGNGGVQLPAREA